MTFLTKIAALTVGAAFIVPATFAQVPTKTKASVASKAAHKTVAKKAAPKASKPIAKKAAVKKPSVKKP